MMRFWEWLERKLETHDDELPERANVVIALGSGMQDAFRPSPQSSANALRAAALWRDGKADNVFLVGGYRCKGPTEAAAMSVEIQTIVPLDRRWVEDESKNTAENAEFVLGLLQLRGWRSVVIVAQQWHARRVRATFRKRWQASGIKSSVVKARSPYGCNVQRRWTHFITFFLWDAAAFIYFKWKGWA